MKKFILLLGPQGSGKSTQAKLLAEKLGYKFISSGALLRELSDDNNPVGLKLSEYWMKGELVPNRMIEDILYNIFTKENVSGFVLDGFPRDIDQLNSFIAEAKLENWVLEKAIYIDISDEECLKRISLRKDIEHRLDETDEALTVRFKVYHEKTEPLLQKYEEMRVLLKVNGLNTVEQIHTDIIKYFNPKS